MKTKVLVTVAILEFLAVALFGGGVVNSGNALVASAILSTVGKDLQVLEITNTKASAQFILVFDSTTLPADGATPLYTITVAANANVFRDFANPIHFNNGIVICNSSTAPTKTIGSADCVFDASLR